MAFTRKTVGSIPGITPEVIEAVMTLHGTSLSDYVPKADVEAQIDAALKNVKPPEINVKEAQEYKDLESQFTDFKARTEARNSDAWKAVKPKFFDTVYDSIDREKDINEQFEAMRKDYEEYFMPTSSGETPPATLPTFSQAPGRQQNNPPSTEDAESSKFISALMEGLPGVKRKE